MSFLLSEDNALENNFINNILDCLEDNIETTDPPMYSMPSTGTGITVSFTISIEKEN